jgi:hypothetical protein
MKNLAPVNLSQPPLDLNKHNAIFAKWVPKVRSELKSSTSLLTGGKTQSFIIRGNQTEGKLNPSITAKTKRDAGAVELVSFNFERHGVFIHKGVGRGYVMAGNFVIRTSKSGSNKTRTPKQWFNPVLEAHLPELANRLAEINTNAALKASGVKIR